MQTSIDVLVVEDSDAHSEITLLAIHRVVADLTVVRVRDPHEALQFIFTGSTNGQPAKIPQFIFLELGASFGSGLQLLDRLRLNARTNRIPVVVLTSALDSTALERSYALGASGYIVKPTQLDDYGAEIEGIVERWLLKKAAITVIH